MATDEYLARVSSKRPQGRVRLEGGPSVRRRQLCARRGHPKARELTIAINGRDIVVVCGRCGADKVWYGVPAPLH